MSERVILCEGYHDRAFWGAWLLRLNCIDAGLAENRRTRVRVQDPFGGWLGKGEWALLSPTRAFIRIRPCGGKSDIISRARDRLAERSQKRVEHLIINGDADTRADGEPVQSQGVSMQAVEAMVGTIDAAATLSGSTLAIDDNKTLVSHVRWETPDVHGPGLPPHHTLERVVCATIAEAYPNRADAVQRWLDSRPGAGPAGPKGFAWSYIAGWYDHIGNYEHLFELLWKDERLAKAMDARLGACGARELADIIAR